MWTLEYRLENVTISITLYVSDCCFHLHLTLLLQACLKRNVWFFSPRSPWRPSGICSCLSLQAIWNSRVSFKGTQLVLRPTKISANKTAGLVWKQMVSLLLLFWCICVKWGNSQLLLIEVYKREPPLQGIWLASLLVFDVLLQACHGQTGSDSPCPRWNDLWVEMQWKQSSIMIMIGGIEDAVGNASCSCLSHGEDMACVGWHLRVGILMFDLWSLTRCWGGNKQDLSFTTDVARSDPEALSVQDRRFCPGAVFFSDPSSIHLLHDLKLDVITFTPVGLAASQLTVPSFHTVGDIFRVTHIVISLCICAQAFVNVEMRSLQIFVLVAVWCTDRELTFLQLLLSV